MYTLDETAVEEFKEQLLREPAPEWKPSARFTADQRWIDEHAAEFAQQYPDQWVAVYNQEVVAASPDLAVVHEEVDKIGDPEVTIFFVEGKLYVY